MSPELTMLIAIHHDLVRLVWMLSIATGIINGAVWSIALRSRS